MNTTIAKTAKTTKTTKASAITNAEAIDLVGIADKIKHHSKQAALNCLEIGKLLNEAKRAFGEHGSWLKWSEENTEIPPSTASRFMRLAKASEKMPALADLPPTKTDILLRLKGDTLSTFMAENDVGDMPTRELESAVREHKQKLQTTSPKPCGQEKHLPIKDLDSTKKKEINPEVIFSKIEFLSDGVNNLLNAIEQNKSHSEFVAWTQDLKNLCANTLNELDGLTTII